MNEDDIQLMLDLAIDTKVSYVIYSHPNDYLIVYKPEDKVIVYDKLVSNAIKYDRINKARKIAQELAASDPGTYRLAEIIRYADNGAEYCTIIRSGIPIVEDLLECQADVQATQIQMVKRNIIRED